jgi:Tfp pilus assembly protein PilO
VSSTLLDELDQMARKAGIKQKEVSFGFDPVEGSDALTRAEITANYEGAYKDLTQFLNLLDHSQRLLIVDSLAATPQPTGGLLEITLKLNAFVREGAAPEAEAARATAVLPGGAR